MSTVQRLSALATCITDHFKELIDELHAQDAAATDDEGGCEEEER